LGGTATAASGGTGTTTACFVIGHGPGSAILTERGSERLRAEEQLLR
jgi:hypothetical protein